MDPMILMYIILGCFTCLALFLVILKVAGRDIFFSFYRWIQPKGCDIFLMNGNRHVDHFYKVAKDGNFIIKKKIYITNPNKLEGLSDEMLNDVSRSMSISYNRLTKKIAELETKQLIIKKQVESTESKPENLPTMQALQMHFTELQNKIELLKGKLKRREQTYYIRRRACYFYIEDDPVPKDMFEFYTEMDCVQLENIIVRAQTKDPKTVANMESQLSWIKKFIIIAAIVAGAAAFMAWKNNSILNQIAAQLGIAVGM